MPWAGLCLFLPLSLSCSQRGHSFWSSSCCPFLPPVHPTWSSRRKPGLWPCKGCVCRYTYVCGGTHLYTQLQLFLGVCTRRWLWGLNQRIAALHSSSDMCMLLLPALGFPELPSLVPFQRTSRACGGASRTTGECPACLSGSVLLF